MVYEIIPITGFHPLFSLDDQDFFHCSFNSHYSMILPTYPGKIPQTSPNPRNKDIPSETVGEGLSSSGMWVRS